MTVLLECASLAKVYRHPRGDSRALHDCDLRVAGGEALALMGPSGCGKSTLLGILGLMIRPTEGSLSLDGEPVPSKESARARVRNARFGFVHQEFAIVNDESAFLNVEIPLEYAHPRVGRRERRKRSEELLVDVGLGGLGGRKAGELSGGERQRVAIARALVGRPDILLADEPTASLDSETAEHIMDLLLASRDRGAAVVIATHDLRVAQRCDRIVTLDYGRRVDDLLRGDPVD